MGDADPPMSAEFSGCSDSGSRGDENDRSNPSAPSPSASRPATSLARSPAVQPRRRRESGFEHILRSTAAVKRLERLLVIQQAEGGAGTGAAALAQLAGDAAQGGGHVAAHLEVPELEVAGLVLELDLVAVLEQLVDGAAAAVEREDLRPVRAVDARQPCHQRLLLRLRPRLAHARGRRRGFAAEGRRRGGRAGIRAG
nr:hypothetical protein CFP56_12278 [Quercus suber]